MRLVGSRTMGGMAVLDMARTLEQRVDRLLRTGPAHDYRSADQHSGSAVDATNGTIQATQAP
jgi:hypothetical protein